MSNREFPPDAVPVEYRNQRISELHVEFLRFGPVVHTGNAQADAEREGKKKSHCIIRVVFRHEAQGQIKGVHIRMGVIEQDIDSNQAVFHGSNASDEDASIDGQMLVKVVKYANQSRSAIASFPFNIREDVTLGQLVDVALAGDKPMHVFKFAIINGAYMGCRDWIMQYFYQLVRAGYVSPNSAQNPPRPLNSIIAKRYSPIENGQSLRVNARPVDKGFFVGGYQRVLAPDMEYDP